MATRKQRAANRRNAQLSTGPKTPEGKDAVRLNALKHGLTAQDAVIFPEDDEAFYELRNNFLDHLQPAGPLETALTHQIAMAQWRLARLRRLETGLFGLGHVDNEEDMNQDYTSLPPPSRLAYVFQKNSEVLATLSRYEARIEHSFLRALHELQRLKPARQRPDPPPPPSMSVSPDEPIKLLKTMDRILDGASTNPYHPKTELNLIPSRAGASACPGHLPRPAAASVVL